MGGGHCVHHGCRRNDVPLWQGAGLGGTRRPPQPPLEMTSLAPAEVGGPAQYFRHIWTFLGGVLALSGKKGVPNTHTIKKKKLTSTRISNAPLLAKIGHHSPHGGESPSSDWMFQDKHPHQRIIYPLGSALVRAIFDWCHPPVTVASTSKKTAKKAGR